MTAPRVVVVCNALDDRMRLQRGIASDSPAASRKVFMMCRALRLAGVRPVVLSLGRGRQDGSGRVFGAATRRVDEVPVVYAPFAHRPLLSPVLSLLGTAALAWRIRRIAGAKTVLFYNAMPAYVPTLLVARAMGWRTVLDLEDGAVQATSRTLAGQVMRITNALFERLCNGGALLACQALAGATALRPAACYYGTAETFSIAHRWPPGGVSMLMGGTVAHDTGAGMLIEAMRQLRERPPVWTKGLTVHVTGKGDAIEALQALARAPGWPQLIVHGRTTDAVYRAIVTSCQVGLALKPSTGALAQTTFPSKVIELACAGLLVLTTDISDVREIFGEDGAVFLRDESGNGLVERLAWIVQHPAAAMAVARSGTQRVLERCDPLFAGQSLRRFLCGATA